MINLARPYRLETNWKAPPSTSCREVPPVRCLRFERGETDLVDDEQRVPPELDQFRFQSSCMVGIARCETH